MKKKQKINQLNKKNNIIKLDTKALSKIKGGVWCEEFNVS